LNIGPNVISPFKLAGLFLPRLNLLCRLPVWTTLVIPAFELTGLFLPWLNLCRLPVGATLVIPAFELTGLFYRWLTIRLSTNSWVIIPPGKPIIVTSIIVHTWINPAVIGAIPIGRRSSSRSFEPSAIIITVSLRLSYSIIIPSERLIIIHCAVTTINSTIIPVPVVRIIISSGVVIIPANIPVVPVTETTTIIPVISFKRTGCYITSAITTNIWTVNRNLVVAESTPARGIGSPEANRIDTTCITLGIITTGATTISETAVVIIVINDRCVVDDIDIGSPVYIIIIDSGRSDISSWDKTPVIIRRVV
jgi:hypothetical protein